MKYKKCIVSVSYFGTCFAKTLVKYLQNVKYDKCVAFLMAFFGAGNNQKLSKGNAFYKEACYPNGGSNSSSALDVSCGCALTIV